LNFVMVVVYRQEAKLSLRYSWPYASFSSCFRDSSPAYWGHDLHLSGISIPYEATRGLPIASSDSF